MALITNRAVLITIAVGYNIDSNQFAVHTELEDEAGDRMGVFRRTVASYP